MYGKLFGTVAAGVVALGFAGNANAIVIDTFNTTQLLEDPSGSHPSSSTVSDAANILGTDRLASVTRTGGTSTVSLSFNDSANSLLTLSNADSTSTSFVDYNGVAGAGLGGVDLTSGGAQNAFDLRIVLNDFATSIKITVFDGDSSSFVTHSSGGSIPASSNVPLLFLYSDYAGIDFTDIERIQLDIDAPLSATDLQLDFLGTTTTVQTPEPMTLAILGIGLAGMGVIRRRRK